MKIRISEVPKLTRCANSYTEKNVSSNFVYLYGKTTRTI